MKKYAVQAWSKQQEDRLKSVASQKTVISVLTAVRISNLSYGLHILGPDAEDRGSRFLCNVRIHLPQHNTLLYEEPEHHIKGQL
jgi:hypothetical protein